MRKWKNFVAGLYFAFGCLDAHPPDSGETCWHAVARRVRATAAVDVEYAQGARADGTHAAVRARPRAVLGKSTSRPILKRTVVIVVVSRISPLPCRPRPPPMQDQEKLARLRRERKDAVREEVAARKELARLNNEARVLEVRSQLDAKLKDRNARRAELLRRESARVASDREARVAAAAERVATTAADRQNRARAAPTARAVPPVRPDPTRVDDDDARDARRLAFARRRRASRRDAAAADRAAARAPRTPGGTASTRPPPWTPTNAVADARAMPPSRPRPRRPIPSPRTSPPRLSRRIPPRRTT